MKKLMNELGIIFLVFMLTVGSFSVVGAIDEITIPRTRLLLVTDKPSYSAGESGFIILRLETEGSMEGAYIEVEIVSPGGKLVEGEMLYTEIPREIVVNPDTRQSVQVLYDESIHYFGPEKAIYRTIDFEIPMDIAAGEYTITGRVMADGLELTEGLTIDLNGPGGFVDALFLVYIVVLLYSLYLLVRRS